MQLDIHDDSFIHIARYTDPLGIQRHPLQYGSIHTKRDILGASDSYQGFHLQQEYYVYNKPVYKFGDFI
jgi:hypothetical protein